MIVLLGGNGYVGSAFVRYFQRTGTPFVLLSRADVDYTDTAILRAWLLEHKPEFLVNAAGYTGWPNVDACEKDKAECLFGNAVFPGRVATACADAGIPWGHVSTGCIYTGRRADGGGFREDDPPNFSFRSPPCSFYSGTKALGEEILADAPDCYLWRIRIPFNEVDAPRNYLTKLLRYACLLEAENSISQLDEFARASYECWTKRIPYGIYNMTNPGSVTTRQVAALLQARGLVDHEIRFFSDESEFMSKAAIAPRSICVLDSSKLSDAGIRMTPVEEALDQALANWIPEPKEHA